MGKFLEVLQVGNNRKKSIALRKEAMLYWKGPNLARVRLWGLTRG